MEYKLPQLPYAYDALEPYIDAETMEIHHDKHHKAYVDKLNEAFAKHPEIKTDNLEKMLSNPDSLPEDIRVQVKNQGGGHLNHSFFWKLMKGPKDGGGGDPKGDLAIAINEAFGSFKQFKDLFSDVAVKLFGSGWAFLAMDKDGKIGVIALQNQDNPIMGGLSPIMTLDVWEHAYYLKYQNKRPLYVEAWWNVLNWDEIEENFKKAKEKDRK